MLTAVWGQWHSDVFVTCNLPSLLAESNLPAFRREISLEYFICTSKSDEATIAAAPAVRALKQILPVHILALPDRAFSAPVETHLRLWHEGVARAKRQGAFFITNPADMVWANGSFLNASKRLRAGQTALYAMFLRVTYETFIEELKTKSRHSPGGTIRYTARELMAETLRHLHPMHCAYLRNAGNFPIHPEYVLWPIRHEGLLMRALATTVLLFDPQRAAVNPHFSLAAMPEDISTVGFMDDSDEIHGVSLTPFLKDFEWYAANNVARIDDVAPWWIVFDGPAHQALASHSFRFHGATPTDTLWARARSQSTFFVTQALIGREMVRIGNILHQEGLSVAASCFFTAYYAARLRRHWRWKGPVIVFAPTDEAFARFGTMRLDELLSAGREVALRTFILAHVVFNQGVRLKETISSAEHNLIAASGGHITVRRLSEQTYANDHKVIRFLSLPHGHQLCVVDGVLGAQRADVDSQVAGVTSETSSMHGKDPCR